MNIEKLIESKNKNNVKSAIYCDRLFNGKNLKFISIKIDKNDKLYAQNSETLERIFLANYLENKYLFYFLGYRPTSKNRENEIYTKLELKKSYEVLNKLKNYFGGYIKEVL